MGLACFCYPLARTSWLKMDPPLPSAAVALILSFLASVVWEEVPVSSLPRAMALSNTFREAYRSLGAASIQVGPGSASLFSATSTICGIACKPSAVPLWNRR